MSAGSTFRRGGAAIAVATAALLAVVWWIGRDGGGGSPPVAPPEAPPAPADAIAVPAMAAAPAPAAEPEAPAPPSIRRRPSAPADADWSSVPAAARIGDLGPALARPVYDALQAAREQMETCFEEERVRQARRPARTAVGDSADTSTILVLRLQSRQGGLDVVDTELEARGDASEEFVSCCRIVLRGWPVTAPVEPGGRRYRLQYLVQ